MKIVLETLDEFNEERKDINKAEAKAAIWNILSKITENNNNIEKLQKQNAELRRALAEFEYVELKPLEL